MSFMSQPSFDKFQYNRLLVTLTKYPKKKKKTKMGLVISIQNLIKINLIQFKFKLNSIKVNKKNNTN